MNNYALAKYVGGGLSLAILLGVVVWLVRSEGRMARETIREAASVTGDKVRDGVVEGSRQAVDRAADRVGELPGRIFGGAHDRSGKGASGDDDTGRKPLSINEVLGKAVEAGHAVSRSVDDLAQEVLGLSVEEEIRLGKEVRQLIGEQHPLVESGPALERLRKLASPILACCSRKDIPYTFLVVDSPEVNAFSHVGGYVYVNRGLLELARDDIELQFVIGHEIAHVDLKHCAKRMTYAARATELGGETAGNLAQLAYMTIALGYSKEDEFDADATAFRWLLKIGCSREEALSFPRHFVRYAEEKGIEATRPKPETIVGKLDVEINNHFRSHPPAKERLARLEAIGKN